MQFKNQLLLVTLFFLGLACKKEPILKPTGEVRLEYPNPTYQTYNSECPFVFDYSKFSKIKVTKSNCWLVLNYPKMKANIYLTYFPIKNKEDLVLKIKDSEKLVHEQSVKASYISPQVFEFNDAKVYGTLFELGGESAINLQFHATDSVKNIITGSVYFSTKPNYDSLQPAINYLKTDVKHLLESFRWK